MATGFKSVRFADSFHGDFKALDAQQQSALEGCIEDLLKDVIPTGRRFHTVEKGRPKIFSVDLYKNVTTHKVSLQVDPEDSTCAILRRVGQHKDIDRNP